MSTRGSGSDGVSGHPEADDCRCAQRSLDSLFGKLFVPAPRPPKRQTTSRGERGRRWETEAENAQIDWTFHIGDQVKLRLVNEMDSDHPMPHPFHVHGAGRFLILARDEVVEPNLV